MTSPKLVSFVGMSWQHQTLKQQKIFTEKYLDGSSPIKRWGISLIKLKNKVFGGIWSIPKGQEKQIPPHWMSYILVENLEESLEKARMHGASIMKPATTAGDFGRFAIITDPTGAHIALWQTLSN